MPIPLEMPKLSDTMTEGTVVRWLKAEGDRVEIGDELAEIETDKATMAMEAFDEGTLGKIMIPEGGKAPIGSVLAVILEEGESVEDIDGGAEPSSTGTPPKTESGESPPAPPKEPAPAAEDSPDSAEEATPSASAAKEGGRILASPLARKVAADKGVDLSQVTGSGPGGRIVRKDVEAAADRADQGRDTSPAPSPAPASAAPGAVVPTVREGDRRIELSTMRRVIAERLLASKTSIPHFYLHLEADAGPLMEFRKQLNVQAEQSYGNKFTVNDFVLKAVIQALREIPAANAAFNGDHIVQFAHIGIAVAVAVEDGLVTPVIKDAAGKSLLAISREVKDLAERARQGKLRPDEFDGATMTVSNLGAYGIESFDAIINPPQAAILSVGAIVEKPVVVDGELAVGRRMDLGISCDHRVIDGAVGAGFLNAIRTLIENPALMLV